MGVCECCKSSFDKTKNRKVFCSHACQAKHAIKKANLFRKPKLRKGITLKCFVCAKDFYVPQYRFKTGKAQFCSRSCLAKEHLPKYVAIYGFKKMNRPVRKYKTISVNGKRVREHRYLMEQKLGRKLKSWEHVHHKDGNFLNNNLENLVVLSNSDHQFYEYYLTRLREGAL